MSEPVILLDPKLYVLLFTPWRSHAMEKGKGWQCQDATTCVQNQPLHDLCISPAVEICCLLELSRAAWQCWWFPRTAHQRASFSFSWWPCHHSSLGLLHFCSCFPWRKDSTQFAFCVKLNKQEPIRWAMIRLGIVMNWNTYLQWLLVGMWWFG